MRWQRTLMIITVTVTVAAASLVPPASAAPSQPPSWVDLDLGGHPTARAYHSMAYDAQRERTVLFGGNCVEQCEAETWEWDGEIWRKINLAVQPPYRRFASMAYDEARGEVVLSGGLQEKIGLPDTWVYDGTSWVERTPAVSPPYPYLTPMAYDPTRAETVLFRSGQTWVWNGTKWRQRSPDHTPPSLQGFGLAFDDARDGVILYGGRSSVEKHHKATWLWNGQDWKKLRNVGSSGTNFNGAITAYDDRVMLFGGLRGATDIDETWVLGAKRWKQLDVDPHPGWRVGHAMVWDAERREAVLFGGTLDGFLADTWVLRP